jgi:hypothetical protein
MVSSAFLLVLVRRGRAGWRLAGDFVVIIFERYMSILYVMQKEHPLWF